MDEKKPSKLRGIMDTASDAADIMRQIGSPGVFESLNSIKETTIRVNDILQSLKAPEMVKNIENFRAISENMNEAATKIQNTVYQLKETGVIDKTTEMINSAKEKIDSFGTAGENNINGQDIRDVSIATKDMFVSIKDLIDELTLTIGSSKRSQTFYNIKETVIEANNTYKTITSAI